MSESKHGDTRRMSGHTLVYVIESCHYSAPRGLWFLMDSISERVRKKLNLA